MRCVLQVVDDVSLKLQNELYSSIQKGYLLFVGFKDGDNIDIIHKMMDKILSLRLFPDENGKTNLSLQDVHGEVMCVSQFTLYADIKKGRRPSFNNSLKGEYSLPLYQETIHYLSSLVSTKQGVFGEDMEITLINHGPFTLMIDSEDL